MLIVHQKNKNLWQCWLSSDQRDEILARQIWQCRCGCTHICDVTLFLVLAEPSAAFYVGSCLSTSFSLLHLTKKTLQFLFFSLLLFCLGWKSMGAAKDISWVTGSRTSFSSEDFFIYAATKAKLLKVILIYPL